MLDDEKQGSRPSSESAGSDFSLWSDTGDLAEQLADEEDPLRINLRGSLDADSGPARPRERRSKHVHYSQHNHLEHKITDAGFSKEAIQIPNPSARKISRAERAFATIMTGDRQKAQMHGLTGKPLLYVMELIRLLASFADITQVLYKCVRIVGGLSLWV